ncbi:MAG TPA: EamA family transporter [Gemmatimonadales bacterium]|nr:EamA family transporter [Gemmatimonadales bacterium]
MTTAPCPPMAADDQPALSGNTIAQAARPNETAGAKTSARLALVVWLCLCAIWGSTWLAIKLGLRDLPPLSFAGLRFAAAALVLFGIAAVRGYRLPTSRRDWILLAYTGLLTITLNYALVFWGEQYISSGLAAVLSATVPLFGLPLAHRYLASESLTRRKVAGVLLGVIGVAIVCSGQLGVGGPLAFWASLGIIFAALATAHAGVLIKAGGTHMEPSVLAGVQMAGGCIPLLLGGMLLEGNPLHYHWTPLAWAALGYLTILGSVIAFLMYYWLIRHTEVTWVLMIPLVTPLVAVAFGVLFGGEVVGWHTALGGAAIIGGVALAVLRMDKSSA